MKIRINRTIKIGLLVTVIGGFILSMNVGERQVRASAGGPPASYTGVPAFSALIPAERTCATCHTGANNLNDGKATFKIVVPASYVPGQDYTLTVSLKSGASMPKAGFQLTALDSTGQSAGTLGVPDTNIYNTTLGLVGVYPTGAYRSYLEHITATYPSDVAGSGQADWKVKWTAPATALGKITFYASGVAADGDKSALGDFIYTASVSTTSGSTTPDVITQNSASGTVSDLTPGGIGSAYGVNLATQAVIATDTDSTTPGIQLPTILGGTTVTVRDTTGTARNAPLFYVSPGQVNYQIPTGTTIGAAMVTFTNSSGGVSTGTVNIASVAPGVFTVTQDGMGLAAAQIQRVTLANVQTFEDIAQFASGTWSAIPIDWKNQTDNLYLVLYGTGVRNFSGQLPNVGIKIGLTTLPVVYVGSQNFFTGVDQVNVFLPRTLAGSGLVDATLTVDGKTANTVKLNFK